MEVGKVYYQIGYESKTVPFLVSARLQRWTKNGWGTWSSLDSPPDMNWKEQGSTKWSTCPSGAVAFAMSMAMSWSEQAWERHVIYVNGEDYSERFRIGNSKRILSFEEFIDLFDRLRVIDKESNCHASS